jgi:predicted phage terminase large subunit-like protein
MSELYEGTKLGAQELLGDIVEEAADALWFWDMLEACRLPKGKPLPSFRRIIVALDPAVTSHAESDETGIIVVGLDEQGLAYVLEDLSLKASPHVWMKQALEAYRRHQADCIVAEVNNGGDLVAELLKSFDRNVPFRGVRASRGKITRAEPVASLYRQQRVFHAGTFKTLETQMTQMCSGTVNSPDRVDALVWGVTELLLQNSESREKTPPKIWSVCR